MGQVEIYALCLLALPLLAAFVTAFVCWRDGHRTGRQVDDVTKGRDLTDWLGFGPPTRP
jgi:hypothetical protein